MDLEWTHEACKFVITFVNRMLQVFDAYHAWWTSSVQVLVYSEDLFSTTSTSANIEITCSRGTSPFLSVSFWCMEL